MTIPDFYIKTIVSQSFGANPLKYLPYGFLSHEGTDYSAGKTYEIMLKPWNVPVPAIESGTVIFAGDKKNNYGNTVVVNSNSGEWWYCHLESVNVRVGQIVYIGDNIGVTGKSGNTKYYHLHLGWRRKPINLLNGWKGFADPAIYIVNNLVYSNTMAFKAGDVLRLDYEKRNIHSTNEPDSFVVRTIQKGDTVEYLGGTGQKTIGGAVYETIDVRLPDGPTGWTITSKWSVTGNTGDKNAIKTQIKGALNNISSLVDRL
jgi:hypothetical protein